MLVIHLLERNLRYCADCWKDGQTQLKVKSVIENILDKDLPESYGRIEFKEKCDKIFDLIIDFAAHGKRWVA